ncbi:MAG TPA: hypothetical protein VMF65_10395 [Acidimicrobiales bacterium]|nr:hypothetical protein [Acidimicrobiales bacterium]
MSQTEKQVSYETDIKPLFREKDRDAMRGVFDLWDYDDVVDNSAAILSKLEDGSMPCDGAWPSEHVTLFQGWVDAGTPE